VPSKKRVALTKSEVMEVKKSPASVAPGTLEKDVAGGKDKGAGGLSPDVEDIAEEIGDDFDDEEDLSGVSDDVDDDLTEDVSEELNIEKFFRDSDTGPDDEDGDIPRGW